jgi:hypothetical protein
MFHAVFVVGRSREFPNWEFVLGWPLTLRDFGSLSSEAVMRNSSYSFYLGLSIELNTSYKKSIHTAGKKNIRIRLELTSRRDETEANRTEARESCH